MLNCRVKCKCEVESWYESRSLGFALLGIKCSCFWDSESGAFGKVTLLGVSQTGGLLMVLRQHWFMAVHGHFEAVWSPDGLTVPTLGNMAVHGHFKAMKQVVS